MEGATEVENLNSEKKTSGTCSSQFLLFFIIVTLKSCLQPRTLILFQQTLEYKSSSRRALSYRDVEAFCMLSHVLNRVQVTFLGSGSNINTAREFIKSHWNLITQLSSVCKENYSNTFKNKIVQPIWSCWSDPDHSSLIYQNYYFPVHFLKTLNVCLTF